MKRRYRISPEGRGKEPGGEEVLRYRDAGKLLHNYQRALFMVHRRPLYKDPKAFLVIVLIVLLAWFISEMAEQPHPPPPASTNKQPVGNQ